MGARHPRPCLTQSDHQHHHTFFHTTKRDFVTVTAHSNRRNDSRHTGQNNDDYDQHDSYDYYVRRQPHHGKHYNHNNNRTTPNTAVSDMPWLAA
jgi:hypothetical protein